MKNLMYSLIVLLISFYIIGFIFNKVGITTEANSKIGSETIYISENGGESWNLFKLKNKNLSLNSELITFKEGTSNLYLASLGGIFEIKENQKINNEKLKNTSDIVKLIQNPHNKNIVYLVIKEEKNQKILISYNGGESFKTIFILEEDDNISALEIDPLIYSTIYLGTKNGLFLISNDNGETWKKKQDFSPKSITAIGIKITDGTIFLGLDKKPFNISYLIQPPLEPEKPEIVFSKDGGNTFSKVKDFFNVSQIEDNFSIKKIVSDERGKVYFVSKNKIFFTNNRELSALNVILPSKNNEIQDFTINPKNPNILYIASGNVIYNTTDGGESWKTFQTPNQKVIKKIKLNPNNSNFILLSTAG